MSIERSGRLGRTACRGQRLELLHFDPFSKRADHAGECAVRLMIHAAVTAYTGR